MKFSKSKDWAFSWWKFSSSIFDLFFFTIKLFFIPHLLLKNEIVNFWTILGEWRRKTVTIGILYSLSESVLYCVVNAPMVDVPLFRASLFCFRFMWFLVTYESPSCFFAWFNSSVAFRKISASVENFYTHLIHLDCTYQARSFGIIDGKSWYTLPFIIEKCNNFLSFISIDFLPNTGSS